MYKGETGNTGPTKGENNAVGKDAEPISQAGDFELIKEGETNVVLVAPHGYQRNKEEEAALKGKKKNDAKTAQLTRSLAKKLHCFAAINKTYDRVKVDLNRHGVKDGEIKEARALKDEWLQKIDDLIKSAKNVGNDEQCFVFHIHGVHDNAKDNADIFLGVGWAVEEEKNRLTATKETCNEFQKLLKKHGDITSTIAKAEDPDTNGFAAWTENILNQYLVYRGNYDKVDKSTQSIQLEIKKAGFRDNEENVEKTAEKLANAIRELPGVVIKDGSAVEKTLVPVDDTKLVDEAYNALKEIFIKHYDKARQEAMLEAGRYIIETFYNNDYEAAKNKRKEPASLRKLIKKLQGRSENAPSKTWVYDAVALAVDSHELMSSDEEAFRTFGKLPLSHKLKLTTVKDMDTKKKLLSEIGDTYMPVRAFGKRIKEVSDYKPTLMELIRQPAELFSGNYEDLFSKDSLKGLEEKERNKIKTVVENKIDRLQEEISNQQRYVEKYNKLLKSV